MKIGGLLYSQERVTIINTKLCQYSVISKLSYNDATKPVEVKCQVNAMLYGLWS